MNQQTCERLNVVARSTDRATDPSEVWSTEAIDELEDHIQSRLMGRVLDLRLVLTDDGLILHGHARTYYAKQLAQHALMEATPLPILANEIEVQ
jgi:hypothetical protein